MTKDSAKADVAAECERLAEYFRGVDMPMITQSEMLRICEQAATALRASPQDSAGKKRIPTSLEPITAVLQSGAKNLTVPIEPTVAMVEAGRAALSQGQPKLQTHARVMWVWEAMLNVAAMAQALTPRPPGSATQEGENV